MEVQNIDGNIYIIVNGTVYSTFGNNANCTLDACPIETTVYGYRPTLPGSITVIVLYALLILINVYLGIRYKTWGFMTLMLLGFIDEILGYVGRIIYHMNPWGQTGFIMQIVLITIGPVFFCAAIYVMIYRVINYINLSKARFNPKLIYWVFITADFVSLILQAVGGAMSSSSAGSSSAGVNIALAGLGFQVATLTIFVAICIDYAIRSRATWTTYKLSTRFQSFLAFLTLAILTIFIRCVYRIYELSEGYSSDSEALRDEPLFNALELSMVLIAAFALVGAHPGFVFSDDRMHEGPAQRIKMEGGKQEVVESGMQSE